MPLTASVLVKYEVNVPQPCHIVQVPRMRTQIDKGVSEARFCAHIHTLEEGTFEAY
jgi:hypothetical protein